MVQEGQGRIAGGWALADGQGVGARTVVEKADLGHAARGAQPRQAVVDRRRALVGDDDGGDALARGDRDACGARHQPSSVRAAASTAVASPPSHPLAAGASIAASAPSSRDVPCGSPDRQADVAGKRVEVTLTTGGRPYLKK